MTSDFKEYAITVILTWAIGLGFLWAAFLTIVNTWAGNFGWALFYLIVASIAAWFLADALDELDSWYDSVEDTCYCDHPIYSPYGHNAHLNPRA